MTAWVLHVDMDQFLAAVEILRRPELAGRAVIVGGRGDPTERAVVSTASYEARQFGVRSGMPLKTAARRCPDAVFLPVDFPIYEAASTQVIDTLRAFPGTVVEVLGWDEAFVGVDTDDPEATAQLCRPPYSRRPGCIARSVSVTRRCARRLRPDSGSHAVADHRVVGGRQPDRGPIGEPGHPTVRELIETLDEPLIKEFDPTTGPYIGRLGAATAPRSSTTRHGCREPAAERPRTSEISRPRLRSQTPSARSPTRWWTTFAGKGGPALVSTSRCDSPRSSRSPASANCRSRRTTRQ